MSIIEEVRNHLAASLDVPVHVAVPASRPESFVVVDPVGGSYTPPFLRPRYAIQAWAPTYAEAEDLIVEACAALAAVPPSAGFDAIPSPDHPVPFQTFDGSHFRWQAVYDIAAM